LSFSLNLSKETKMENNPPPHKKKKTYV
jgi:hypothetical protein